MSEAPDINKEHKHRHLFVGLIILIALVCLIGYPLILYWEGKKEQDTLEFLTNKYGVDNVSVEYEYLLPEKMQRLLEKHAFGISINTCRVRGLDVRLDYGKRNNVESKVINNDFGYVKNFRHLKYLTFKDMPLSDLSPLEGLELEMINLQGTQVTDLSPLKGMRLKYLDLGETPVSDLSPLKGIPLVELYLNDTPITDLSPLKGMPLRFYILPQNPKDNDNEAKKVDVDSGDSR